MRTERETATGRNNARWLLYSALYSYLGWPDTSNSWLAPFIKAWTTNEYGLYIAPVIIDFPCSPEVHWTYERQQQFQSHLKQCIPGWWEVEYKTAGQGYIRATLMVHHVETEEEHTNGEKSYRTDRYPPDDLVYTEYGIKRPSIVRSVLRGLFHDEWKTQDT
jgi:hypothetical protein